MSDALATNAAKKLAKKAKRKFDEATEERAAKASYVQHGNSAQSRGELEKEIADKTKKFYGEINPLQDKLKQLDEQEKARDKSGIDTLERVTIEYIAMIVGTFELIHNPLRGIISIDLSDHLLRERIGVEGCGAGDADVGKLLNVLANCMGHEGMDALTSLNLATPGASGSFDRASDDRVQFSSPQDKPQNASRYGFDNSPNAHQPGPNTQVVDSLRRASSASAPCDRTTARAR